MVENTLRKFGFPDTLVADTPHWAVLCRPEQPTLGSAVLVCREPVQSFGAVGAEAMAALAPVVARLERVLSDLVGYERINYLMLMMVDPDVHFHVIPRYPDRRGFAGLDFPDNGWPGPPALTPAVKPDAQALAALVAALRERWAGAA